MKFKEFFVAAVGVLIIFLLIIAMFPNVPEMKKGGLGANDGLVVYYKVNFREEPNLESKIIDEITLGEVVEVLSENDGWKKVKYDGKIGYLISDSVSFKRIMFDISDFNWNSEYKSIEEFKKFTQRAMECSRFAGYYVQVTRTQHVNTHWKEIVEALNEMRVPYGLYMYPSASTVEEFKVEYEVYKNALKDVDLKYNHYPFMLDLENGENQTEVLKYVEELYNGNCIVYANSSTMKEYGYHKYVEEYWVAHYGLRNNIPAESYKEQEGSEEGLDPVVWQFTQKGSYKLFGTRHLDINIIDDEWYEKYNK